MNQLDMSALPAGCVDQSEVSALAAGYMSFVSKVLLRIKWKFELTVHFKHEMLGK